jgi:hypothetical protein
MEWDTHISKLTAVPVRTAFPHEAHHFTVWLTENIDVLSARLGLPLTVEQREMPVGRYSADLVCRDAQGNRVVIENQLESTDHDHLGKMMTYMGNLKANTGIWITPSPRIEHITAIESFNSHPNIGLRFYLVKLETVWIDNSRIAPLFTVLARPLDQPTPLIETAIEQYLNPEKESAESDSINSTPVWCIYPRRDESTYRLFMEQNVIGLGFGNLGDLRDLPVSAEAFKEAWARKNPTHSPAQVRSMYPMFYSFIHRVKKGDLVIYPPTWRERIIHVGKITGDYEYRGGLFREYRDIRPVKWILALPRDDFSQAALKGIGVNLAFFQVHNQTFLDELKLKLRQVGF